MRSPLASGPVLVVAALLASCASTPAEAPTAEMRVAGRPLRVLPVVDRSGALAPTETARLRDDIAAGIAALRHDRRGGLRDPLSPRDPLDIPLVETPSAAALLLEVEVRRFDPDGSVVAGVIVGLGAGRPGYEARLALVRGPAATSPTAAPEADAAPLAEWVVERDSSRFAEARPEKGGPRGAILGEIRDAAVAFVRRRR